MSGSTDQVSQSTRPPVVDPVVRGLLRDHEQGDSMTRGKIVDLATLSTDDPYENFEIPKDRIINQSKRRMESVVKTGSTEDCIALAVEHPSGGVFIDFFTYKTDGESDFPSIESLTMSLGVDISSVHHLIGNTVDIVQEEGTWVICEYKNKPPVKSSVTREDFLNPLSISALLIPLSALIGWQTTYSVITMTWIGVGSTLITYAFLLYITLAAKRDHALPGVLGAIFTPDYTEGAGVITDGEEVTAVENGELRRIVTLAEENERDSPRTVLHNLAIVVLIPPIGEKVIPIPAPTTGWHGTTIKSTVYSLSSSVESLDRAEGELIPLYRDGDQIRVNNEELNISEPSRSKTFAEQAADGYVSRINSILRTPVRDDIYR